ncbi:MAG: hypothetical protein HYT16_02395 [DPANN group archaeon]|nr:hypothetical protein [DPANN group archaeon]
MQYKAVTQDRVPRIFCSRKTITPIIAVILTMMIAVAAGGAMFYWISRLQTQDQGAVTQSQQRLFETLSACLSLSSFDMNLISNRSNFVLQNCGSTKINFGDANAEDFGIISSQGIDPCTFSVNTTSCIGCPVFLKPGEAATLSLNWTNEKRCVGQIVAGKQYQVLFNVDRTVSASRDFVPESAARCGLNFENATRLAAQAHHAGNPPSYCYKFQLTNTGNAADTYNFTNSTGTNCGSARILTIGCGATGIANHTISLAASENYTIYFNQTVITADLTCTSTITAASLNCSASISKDTSTSYISPGDAAQ